MVSDGNPQGEKDEYVLLIYGESALTQRRRVIAPEGSPSAVRGKKVLVGRQETLGQRGEVGGGGRGAERKTRVEIWSSRKGRDIELAQGLRGDGK